MSVTDNRGPAADTRFYVTGGTLRPDALCYVTRRADGELYDGLSHGEFCYVLTARQMGKSSLIVRTATRLRLEGVGVVLLDLTALGQNLSPEQWYDGLRDRLGQYLELEEELEAFWETRRHLSPVQRWITALRQVVLARVPGRVVIFVDEIDVVQSLPFSTDEFFAAIRECYNHRSEDPEFARLTFCLVGVATPSDLIRDTRLTPFNIGRRIELTDFTEAEAAPLAAGLTSPPDPLPEAGRGSRSLGLGRAARERQAPLPASGEAGEPRLGRAAASERGGGRPSSRSPGGRGQPLLHQILHWTGGHPYLTQRLCRAVAEAGEARLGTAKVYRRPSAGGRSPGRASGPEEVDLICAELFLTPRARERDDNLMFVRERLLRSEADLAALLELYARVRRGQRVPDDDSSPLVGLLRLSGIVRPSAGDLRVRNRIYAWVFDREWVQANMPDAELRRQRAAYRRGLVRAVGVSAVIVAVMAGLALTAVQQRRVAIEQLVRSHVATGMRQVEEGNTFEALPWFLEALRLDQGRPDRERMHRIRFAAALRECPKLVQMWFHQGPVTAAQWSPDGRRVLTASADGTAQVWDAATGRPVGPPLRHAAAIRSARFSPDGRQVVTASADGTARVWDAKTSEPVSPPLKHGAGVNHASFSPDGRRVVTASNDQTARVWEAHTGKPVTRPLPCRTPVHHAWFSPDGRRVLTAGFLREKGIGEAQVWDAATGAPVTEPLSPGGDVLSAEFSPDGRRVLTANGNRTTVLWDAVTGAFITALRTSNAPLHASFSPDGRRVVTSTVDRTVYLWNAATGQPTASPLRHRSEVNEGWFSPDGRQVVTASNDQTVRVWDAETGEPAAPPLPHSAAVEHVAFSPEGRRLVTASVDGIARVWDLAAGLAALPPLQPGRAIGSRLAFSSDSRYVLAVDGERTVEIWDAATGRRIGPRLKHARGLQYTAFSPEGRRVITAGADGTASIWELASGRRLIPPLKHRAPVFHASFSPDGRRVVTASEDGTAQVWDAATGRPVGSPLGHTKTVYDAEFSPDGQRVVTASEDKTARIWDAETGKPLTPPLKHRHKVGLAVFSPDGRRVLTSADKDRFPQNQTPDEPGWTSRVWDATTGQPLTPPFPGASASFSPDGRRVVTANHDRTARVWDAATGRLALPPLRHDHTVKHAAFSPDGRAIVTAGWDYVARLWDAATGEPLTPPLRHAFRVEYAAFRPDGRRLATASGGHFVWLWDLPREERPLTELVQLTQLLMGHRTDAAGDAQPLPAHALRAAWQQLRPPRPDHSVPQQGAVLAWHWQARAEALQRRRWSQALAHLDALIEADPTQAGRYRERAQTHAELGQWDQAAADFEKFIALVSEDAVSWGQLAPGQLESVQRSRGPGVSEDSVSWGHLALTYLAGGDLAGYRRTCARMLAHYGTTPPSEAAGWIAWTCGNAPDAVPNLEGVADLVKRACVGVPRNEFLEPLGALLYRAGHFAEAARCFHEAMALGEPGNGDDWLLLAMAHARLGQPAEARRWLSKATQQMDQPLRPRQEGLLMLMGPFGWGERVRMQLLRREAEAMVATSRRSWRAASGSRSLR
jgi:WD40 repeat protein/tetratricopeptide (TPR) repeat protein